MAAKIFRINYKSDFILTLNSDAGWMTPFCIKFFSGAPSQAFFVGWDGETYTHCAYDPGEPTKLLVQFDDHHLPIGDLKFQIAYHFTVADFPNDTEDEVTNPANITTEIDGQVYQVMLDFTGETAPEIQFSLPAYANEAQRIANEEQRIAHEAIRIVNEESRIAAETIRQQNEAQRIAQETSRVNEFATLKSQSQAATRDANDAATLANQKAQLAEDKAALADDAATLANAKAQLAADKAALANDAAQLANEKAALAQQKAEYAQQQGGYAKDQGDYAKNQGDYAKEQGDTALADHQRAEADHGIAVDDHTQAGNDHTRAESDHGIAVDDHTQAGNDHTRAESDHTQAGNDHTQAGNDHTRAESDHGIAVDDHTQAESDHTRAESDHAAVEVYVDSLGAFDISAYHATGGVLAKYADLTAALGTNGANVPDALRKGGMSVKFVQSSDNKYVQYRLMADEWSTTEADWQGVDTELSLNSKNLIESGAVKYEELRQTFNVADFFNMHRYIRPSDHQPVENDNYRCTDYIKVKQGDIIGYRLTTNYNCGICLYSDKSFTSYVSTLVENGLDRTEGTVTISQNGYILCCTQYGDIDNGYIYFVGSVSEKITKLRKADEGLQENIYEQGAAITSLGESVNEQFDADGLLIANSLKRNNIGSSDFTRDVYIRSSDGYQPSSSVTKCTGFIPVVAGDVIKYRLFATGTGSTLNACALYSEADATKFVSMLLTMPNEGLYEGTITIPSNGYIVVQNSNKYSSPYIAFKDVLDDKLDALDAESEKITTHHVDSPMVCVFHDNYSRTMQNWEIGQNSAVGSTQNTYSEVNDLSQYDDGLRVDEGATFIVNSNRNIPFSLRKLNVDVENDYVIETNVPSTANGRVCFGFDVIDNDNFTLLYVQEASSNRYQVILQQIINRSFGDAVSKNIYKAKAEVLSFCFIGSNIFIKLDDTVSAVMNRPVGMGKDIHIAAYKSRQTHFDFVNVFNYSFERTFNPNYIIDSGVSEIPTITTSANSGGYAIENTNVHYEGYADKFHLTPNDPEIHNGIRAERSVDTLISSNLRNFKVEFDVFIPSTDVEDDLGDIMCQMHDRDGSVARGKVPFILRYQNGKLNLSIYSTHAPQATTFITGLNNYELCSITKDTWVHVEFEIKERYEKNQHPLTVVKVDGKVCYVSHEANCFNDVVPSELQYGIYKNASEWGTGVTERNRFFDNLIINYH